MLVLSSTNLGCCSAVYSMSILFFPLETEVFLGFQLSNTGIS